MATTSEQNRTVGKFGEPTVVDKNTFQIKGVDTGTIYGQGRSLSEALALQTQGASGGTPTVSGRPDLYAVSPTAQESIKTIEGAAGQQVTPRVATLSELEAVKAGTLESFNKATGAPQAAAPITNFADAVRETINQSVTQQKDTVLNAEQNFDTQLLLQRGALYAALLDENLTPEDLRWLSPSQQAAVRSGNKATIKAQIGGLQSIMNARSQAAEDEEAKQKEEEAAALNKLKTLQSLGMLGAIDSASISTIANSLGLEESALYDFIESEGQLQWELRTDPNGNLEMFKFDPITGAFESKILQYKTKSGSGSGSGILNTLSYEDFKKLQESLTLMSMDEITLQGLYQEYLDEMTEEIDDKYYFDLISETDEKKMLAEGFNPGSASDIKKYIEKEYQSEDELSSDFKEAMGIE